MRGIAINGRYLTRPVTGVDRFAIELLAAWLPRYGCSRPVRAIVPTRSAAKQVLGAAVPVNSFGILGGHAWEQIELPLYCRDEFLLNLCNTGPLLHGSQLIVLHDTGFLENPSAYSRAFRSWYPFLFAHLLRRSQAVATVSNFAADELMRNFRVCRKDIEVIYEGGEHILRSDPDRSVLSRFDLVDRKYVLAVGSRNPNKNFGAIVCAAESLKDLGIVIVVAGGSNSRVFAGSSIDLSNLVMTGYVTDGQLRALYESAQCFVFPSYYEGFGLPPLEAMHCGCPVVVSNRASLPEVCGEAVVYFDPSDSNDIASQLRRVLFSEALRMELREAGFARARTFSWQRAAERLESILQGIDL